MPNMQFKNARQHQEKTTLPPFALVVLPTHLTNLPRKPLVQQHQQTVTSWKLSTNCHLPWKLGK
jgi:hypothetical protein